VWRTYWKEHDDEAAPRPDEMARAQMISQVMPRPIDTALKERIGNHSDGHLRPPMGGDGPGWAAPPSLPTLHRPYVNVPLKTTSRRSASGCSIQRPGPARHPLPRPMDRYDTWWPNVLGRSVCSSQWVGIIRESLGGPRSSEP
jgi:hypothetical protein